MSDINYGEILEALNNKTDRDLGNLSTEGRVAGGGLAFPTNNSVELSTPTNGAIYTAPANGYFRIDGTSSAAGAWISFGSRGNDAFAQNTILLNANWTSYYLFPATAGAEYVITFSHITSPRLRFTYAEGSNN